MRFQYNDGGRSFKYKGLAGDCVVRAIAIAFEKPYQEIYDELFALNKLNNKSKRSSSPRDGGTSNKVFKQYLADHNWKWTPTMLFGQGCKVHLKAEELPTGRIIVNLSKHLCAVIDGVIHDTYDCSRNETRCVYGYWKKGE